MQIRDQKAIAESFLLHIWDGGHLDQQDLRTTEGQKVEILFKGHWNRDAGPDFRGAILRIGGELKKGDIEIHARLSDWYTHGHDQDPGYNEVILHAVLWPEGLDQKTCKQNGESVPLLILGNFLDESLEHLQRRLQLSSGSPQRQLPKSCRLSEREEAFILERIERWGYERLRLKKERFREEVVHSSYDQLLYQGIMEALGYSKNQATFLKLAFRVPFKQIFETLSGLTEEEALLKAQAILLGAAGFLPPKGDWPSTIPAESRRLLEQLYPQWATFQKRYKVVALNPWEWQFFRLRPANFPTRRLAGMAFFLTQAVRRGLFPFFLNLLQTLSDKPRLLIRELQRALIVKSYGYWEQHYHLGESSNWPRGSPPKNLIGPDKAREILVNILLPLLWVYAEETEDLSLATLVRDIYTRLPKLEENEITRRMREQILSPRQRPASLINSALRHQGLIHIFKCFCRSGLCEECLTR